MIVLVATNAIRPQEFITSKYAQHGGWLFDEAHPNVPVHGGEAATLPPSSTVVLADDPDSE